MSPERPVHHELCFGCGRTNLFGLLLDMERVGERQVRGRGFVKQDHQGADRGVAHEGVVLSALSEAMAFACGPEMRAVRASLEIAGPVPVGAFLEVEARAEEEAEAGAQASASAHVDGEQVAAARGIYRRL